MNKAISSDVFRDLFEYDEKVDGWTTDAPESAGHYWFYGWSYRWLMGSDPKIHSLVILGEKSDSQVFLVNGNFFQRREFLSNAVGRYKKKKIPRLPSLEHLKSKE